MEPLKGGDLLGRYFDLAIGAPRLQETNNDRPQQSQYGAPPDAPDEGKSQEYGEERRKEARRIVALDMQRFIGPLHVAIRRGSLSLLHGPEGVHPVRLRQKREVPRRRR